MGDWLLIDYMLPVDWDACDPSCGADFPTVRVESEGQLREELSRFRRRQPSLLSLVSPSGDYLDIGLGPVFSGLYWVQTSAPWGLKIAVNPHPAAPEPVIVLDGGGGRTFDPERLLPTDEVIEAAVRFYRDGRVPDTVQWWTVT
jgi:hypothetical protein